MGDYVKVVTENKNYMVLSTMKSFLNKLPKNQFIRIHKSYIVNLKKVINFTTTNVNTDGENSSNYNNGNEYKLLSQLIYNIKYHH